MDVDHKKINRWVRKGLLLHFLLLCLLCFTLPAVAESFVQRVIYDFVLNILKIKTQVDISPLPLVSIFTSVYILFSSIILFVFFIWGLNKQVEPPCTLRAVLYSRYADQLPLLEDLTFFKMIKGLITVLGGMLLLAFHLFWLNDLPKDGKGDLYPLAFNSRIGIFVVQSIASFWALAVWSLLLLWWLQAEMWYQHRFKSQ